MKKLKLNSAAAASEFTSMMNHPCEGRTQKLQRLNNFDESWFWKRLDHYTIDPNYRDDEKKKALDHLRVTVREVAGQAKFIGNRIGRFLPQYTSHDEQHFLNVLMIMDALTPNEVMEQLTPLECGLCIMAAYTHDLGMALSDEQHQDLHGRSAEGESSAESQRFLAHRDRFAEELRQIQKLKEKGGADAEHQIQSKEGHILSDYIRATHAGEQQGRIGYWLNEIADIAGNKQLYVYGKTNYQKELELIGSSHGRSAHWLRDQLAPNGAGCGFSLSVGLNESVNIAFPALLLRLADIMDFDSSRTPEILFRHIGIKDSTSIVEWNKHRSIDGWKLRADSESQLLRYEATCYHPVYHKCIEDFTGEIRKELEAVRKEAEVQQKELDKDEQRYTLHLPVNVDLNIKEEGYKYRDVEFRLDQDKVMQLLMGESLYGDPSLCIRELLQNALDAVQLRDMRLKMREDYGIEPFEPVDNLKTFPNREKEELNVILTWGQDEESGQDFIRVTDHGVGMTGDSVENYFAQIGKSFYRSSEFEQERAMLSRKGLIISPISQFGIGVLSSFMIADSLQIRTCPGGADDNDRKAYDITISGAGNLFWLKNGTLDHQGSEVTVYLKPNYQLSNICEIGLINQEFNQYLENEDKRDYHKINPDMIALRHIIWPLFYPIEIQPPSGLWTLTIDDKSHHQFLMSINRIELIREAEKWDCPQRNVGNPGWGFWEYLDKKTHSRIRLLFPQHDQSAGESRLPVDPPADGSLCRQDELAALIHRQLFHEENRTRVTVKGMFVSETNVCDPHLMLSASVGTYVWVDLCGEAVPRLTADRRRALEPENATEWHTTLEGVFTRMSEALAEELAEVGTPDTMRNTMRNLLSGFDWHPKLRSIAFPEELLPASKPSFSWNVCIPSWKDAANDKNLPLGLLWAQYRLLQKIQFSRTFSFDFIDDSGSDHWQDIAFVRDRIRDLAREVSGKLGLSRAEGSEIDRILEIARKFIHQNPSFAKSINTAVLQEAFSPNLEESLPMLDLWGMRGEIGDGILQGPSLIKLNTQSDKRTLQPIDLKGTQPRRVVQLGYDLVFPMTSVPLGKLRCKCPSWRKQSQYRQIGIVPFLLPGFDNVWEKDANKLKDFFNVEYIYALLPNEELWMKAFNKWTEEDWQNCTLSALWDISSGQVLWAKGAISLEEIRLKGKNMDELLH